MNSNRKCPHRKRPSKKMDQKPARVLWGTQRAAAPNGNISQSNILILSEVSVDDPGVFRGLEEAIIEEHLDKHLISACDQL